MTKLKSKKITKSTVAVIIMAIAMVAMLAFGGTYAYFSANAQDVTGDITTGTIKLSTSASTVTFTKQKMLPTESETVHVSYTDSSDRTSFVFFTVTSEWETALVSSDVDIALSGIVAKDSSSQTITTATISDSGKTVYWFKNEENSGKTAVTNATFDVYATVTMSGAAHAVNGTDSSNAMGNTLTVTFTAQSIQAEGFTGADDAAKASAAWTALKTAMA